MLKVGQCVSCVTKTKNDTFGTVAYEVMGVNLECPKKGCRSNDGIEFMMLGGTGPAARRGIVIRECGKHVSQLHKEGKMKIVSDAVKAHYDDTKGNKVKPGGVIELS